MPGKMFLVLVLTGVALLLLDLASGQAAGSGTLNFYRSCPSMLSEKYKSVLDNSCALNGA